MENSRNGWLPGYALHDDRVPVPHEIEAGHVPQVASCNVHSTDFSWRWRRRLCVESHACFAAICRRGCFPFLARSWQRDCVEWLSKPCFARSAALLYIRYLLSPLAPTPQFYAEVLVTRVFTNLWGLRVTGVKAPKARSRSQGLRLFTLSLRCLLSVPNDGINTCLTSDIEPHFPAELWQAGSRTEFWVL